MAVEITCKHCGKPFSIKPCLVGKKKFCSRACHYASYGKPIKRNCKQCGKEFYIRPPTLKRGKGIFCSHSCASIHTHTGRPKPKSRDNIKKAIQGNIGREPWNKKPYFKLRCEICDKEFEVPQRRKDTARYCSRECSYEAKRRVTGPGHPLWRRVEMACEQCGKKVWVKRAKVHEFRFCSRQCVGAHISMIMAQRNGPTPIEQLMMDELDRRKIPYRSQHPIAHWVIDITLPQYRVAIECDGNYWHSSPEQQEKDANKDKWLQAHKWTIFRFLGSEINESPTACVDQIVAYLNNHPTS